MWSYLYILFFTQLQCVVSTYNCSAEDEASNCVDGIIIPIWRPFSKLTLDARVLRGTIFFLMIAYMFLGVSIVADRFMASIEVITSKERHITVKKPGMEPFKIKVRIWNDTVSNLTLMALGSSAPEILLSIIEIIGKKFEAGELGPNTIVGSAAFNLFMIIALCVMVIPANETRKQNHLDVFCVTSAMSIFAYIWMYLILAVTSPGIIEVWEGALTFLFFPLTVLTAWIADVKIIQKRFLPHRYRTTSRGLVATEGAELKALARNDSDQDPTLEAFEDNRVKFIEIMKDLRKKNPEIDPAELEKLAEYEFINEGPKSRAFYRIQATRKLIRGGDVVKRQLEKEWSKSHQKKKECEMKLNCRVFFNPAHYTVLENIGVCIVNVCRDGGDENLILTVDYCTEDGTAEAGNDYVNVEGTLTFYPHEEKKEIAIQIIDDDIFEEDEHFYVRLSNLRVGYAIDSMFVADASMAYIDLPQSATVMILDDDHAGVFSFENEEVHVNENCGSLFLKITRSSGCRGRVAIPITATDGTAAVSKHYSLNEEEVLFDDNQFEAFAEIGIVDTGQYERFDYFYVRLGEPIWQKAKESPNGNVDLSKQQIEIADSGKPRLGKFYKCKVTLAESKEFQNIIDRMLKATNTSLMLGTSSWRDQFKDALSVQASKSTEDLGTSISSLDDDSKKIDENQPTFSDYLMHFITVPWKLLLAGIPPTSYWGGWACFVSSIALIGFLTAVIGDLASQFGCWVGLNDAVTAISFVALGTSIPDTFASKVAAVQDKYADSSIGNVTGSNAVNVFLGIGIAWTLAAVYHWFKGDSFRVNPGSLAFSVTIFCIEALICTIILILRRHPSIGGELGGPLKFKVATSAFLVSLWVTYVVLSSLESYCIIAGF